MKKVALWSLALSLFLGSLTPAFGARRLRFKEQNINQKIQDSELAVRPAKTRAYTESWILWSWNKQGYNVYALFVATRIVFGIKLGVQLTIRTPDGKVEHKMVEYSSSNYRYKKGKLDILVPKKHRITYRKNKGFISINFKKWGIRFNFKKLLSGYRLQNGPICQRKKCFNGLAYGPRLSVKGHIRVNGKMIPYKGMGFADHSWQDVMPHHMANRWFAGRAINSKYTINTSHLLVPNKWSPRNMPALMIAKGNKWIFRGDRKNTKFVARGKRIDKGSGYRIPQRMLYRGTYKGVRVKVDIKHLEEYDNFDILSQFNRVLRFILQKFISKPFLFRYKARFKVQIRHKDGTSERFTMIGFTEYVFLNK